MFQKILIANRGEIALRIIRACQELGIRTVAVYSTADRDSLHVKFADEAVCIGPPPSKLSYLNIPQIMMAAELTNAEAIHPGYGFLSENAHFADVCHACHIKFIGPSAEVIKKMGDKATAKATMQQAGVPTIPGSEGVIQTLQEAQEVAQKMGYPIMLKATAGGGGKGMRRVHSLEDLPEAWASAQQEAANAFGQDGLYIEKLLVNPRHIEVQIAGDQFGTVCHFSERDCSIQHRHQKLVEEAPSPWIDDTLRHQMGQAAIKGAQYVGYEGVGTMEFLVDSQRQFYFMEMNTRIQVEHPVTEEAIGCDLIKEQIALAAGKRLAKDRQYIPQGYAMECRINAQDPYRNFAPSPGTITSLHIPGGHGIRVDTHIYAGYQVPPHYDAMIAKLITRGTTREEVIAKMQSALHEFVVEGIKTTIPFHQQLMQDASFRKGVFTTAFLDSFQLAP